MAIGQSRPTQQEKVFLWFLARYSFDRWSVMSFCRNNSQSDHWQFAADYKLYQTFTLANTSTHSKASNWPLSLSRYLPTSPRSKETSAAVQEVCQNRRYSGICAVSFESKLLIFFILKVLHLNQATNQFLIFLPPSRKPCQPAASSNVGQKCHSSSPKSSFSIGTRPFLSRPYLFVLLVRLGTKL